MEAAHVESPIDYRILSDLEDHSLHHPSTGQNNTLNYWINHTYLCRIRANWIAKLTAKPQMAGKCSDVPHLIVHNSNGRFA